jgi:hypothetical protein
LFGHRRTRRTELLFRVTFTYSENGGVMLTGCSVEGARLPVAGELLEVRSPDGERVQACAWKAGRGEFSAPSPVSTRPIDRVAVFVPGALRQRSWGHSEVWAVGAAEAEPGAAPDRGGISPTGMND